MANNILGPHPDRVTDALRLSLAEDRGQARHDLNATRRILVAEDVEENRLLLRAYLKNMPCRIDFAPNGLVALKKFKLARYALVLMDVQMPLMDGYAATRAMREHEAQSGLSNTPIVALTAHALLGSAAESIAAGCNAHVTKPIKKKTLLDLIQEYATV